jgi:two-component system NtrC family sensor kinase
MKILLVDDQPLLLSAIKRMLSDHQCTTAMSADHALDLLSQKAFDGILCDLMMPDMDGAALHAVLAETQPDHAERMVFCTGGATNSRLQNFLNEEEDRPILTKPFDQAELETVIDHWKELKRS